MYSEFISPFISLLYLSTLFSTTSYAAQDCLLLGPKFPPPQRPSQNPSVTAAKISLYQQLQQTLQNGSNISGSSAIASNSFSVDLFSINEANSSIFTYHNSASSLSNSTQGVKKVDSNTIYRVGSITKLFTVLVFLIEAGDARWNDPITRFVPELLAPVKGQNLSQSYNPVNQVTWSDITIGALASQMAGIGRENSFSDISAGNATLLFGLPPVTAGDVPACGVMSPCDRKAFFNSFLNRHPVIASFSTPVYSNIGFQLLAYALESISKRPFRDLFEDNLVKPLNLTRTSLSKPSNDSMGVIGDEAGAQFWAYDSGDEGPALAAYSTSSEMTTIGRAILKSTLLSPAQTRRWMKPHAHTASLLQSVGAPWEIRRATVGNNSTVDLYTKFGDVGYYSSMLVLIPDYEVGFTVLLAGRQAGFVRTLLSDGIVQAFLPALDSAARFEANNTFAGRYVSSVTSLNSSITLSTDSAQQGLVVSSWVSNGTDLLNYQDTLAANRPSGPRENNINNTASASTISYRVRLIPTNLKSPQSSSNGTQEVAYRGIAEVASAPAPTGKGVFADSCQSWVGGVDAYMYKTISIDEFVFTLGSDGKAISVLPRAFGAMLQKMG